MLIDPGEKIHYMRRRLFKEAPKRHVIGEVIAGEYGVLRVRSVMFIGSPSTGQFERMGDVEERLISTLDSLSLITVLPRDFEVAQTRIQIEQGRVVATDGRHTLYADRVG
jgi:hypothetical protein